MNRETVFESSAHSVFRFSDPANVGKSFLDGNKDHLLHQARSEIVEQVVSMSFSNKRMIKDWNWRTPHHVYIESRREQSRLQEEFIIYK